MDPEVCFRREIRQELYLSFPFFSGEYIRDAIVQVSKPDAVNAVLLDVCVRLAANYCFG